MELRDYLRGLRRHWLAVFLMMLVGVGAAYGWYTIQTPVYEATAIGLVQTRAIAAEDEANDNLAANPVFDTYASSKVPTYMDMATWKAVADGAVEQLGLQEPVAQVVSRIAVENTQDTNIIRITAQGDSPQAALGLAQAWMTSLVAEIDATEGDGSPGSAPVTITMDQSAVVPTAPIYPDLQTALVVGGVLGLGVGVAFALMRTASDRRIRAADDVESRTGLPVVGTIPLTTASADSRLFDVDSQERGVRFAVAEALRTLRTNLQFMDVDNPPRIIVVTSPLPGDGKSTIACNLAVTLSASGRSVVLMDGDLRRSTVATTMGLPGGAGLSDVLSGRAEIADVLQRSPQSPTLFVLAAGSVPPNPSEVLGSARMRQLLSDLAKHATVIIDAPPLLPVTDGAVLTHQSDGALLVVGLGKTTYDLLDKAVATLTKAGGRALGVVFNKVPLRGNDSSAYSYGYRADYAPDAKADTKDGVEVIDQAHADFNLDGVFAEATTGEPPVQLEPQTATSRARTQARPRARRG